MKHYIQDRVYFIAGILEIIISAIMLAVIGYLTLVLVFKVVTDGSFLAGNNPMETFFAYSLTLIIGVEFIKMLVRHTPANVLEVLILVTSRQIVMSHASIFQTLMGVLAIILLFAARKYLLVNADDQVSMVYPAYAKVVVVNALAGVHLPYRRKMTLEQLVRECVDGEVVVGTVVDFPNMSLKVVSVADGKVMRIELIKEVGKRL